MITVNDPDSFAQLNQDVWVMRVIKTPGFFLELGAFHPVDLSNTYLLEKNGWRGISVDPFPSGDWGTRPNTTLVTSVVTGDGRDIDFIKADELGGIEEHVGCHRNKVMGKPKVRLPSKTPTQILEECNAPMDIDYISLDTEGSELEILQAFPFDKYNVKALTVEHNYEEPKRTMIKNLLRAKGFVHAAPNMWDDCFVHESIH
jgi:hypothetical protein